MPELSGLKHFYRLLNMIRSEELYYCANTRMRANATIDETNPKYDRLVTGC